MDFWSSLAPYYPSEEIASLREGMARLRGHGLYLNTGKMDVDALRSFYPHLTPHPQIPEAFLYEESEYPLGKSLLHNLGAFYIMDPAAMLVPYYLAPKPGEKILDYCAAPGGKTCVAALLLGDSGVVLSNDLSYSRSLQTSQNVERLGLHNVVVTSGDFALAKSHYPEAFDAIILDAPCSGSAMFRKDPRLEQDWTHAKVLRCAATQAELLEHAAMMLSSGGRIAYSTCSFSYEENEGVILPFLKKHPEFEAVSLPEDPTFYRHIDLPQAIHLFPHRHPGEGQFLCLLRHKGDKAPSSYPASRPMPKKLSSYGIEGFDHLKHGESYYALPHRFDVSGLSLLRYGVCLGEEKAPFLPSHSLAVSGLVPTMEVDKEKALRYLRGETFPLPTGDGFHAISYLGMPLGYVKVSQGTAKNHYPKGLRRNY